MKRYFRDKDGHFRESASEEFLMHSTGKWDRSKTKYVKIVKTPAGNDAYLYPDDLEPGKKYGPKVGDAKADEKEEEKKEPTDEERYGAGNIDLYDRPVLKNEDGSISTVESFSTNIDGVEVLLPTISRDKDGNPIRISEDEAIEKYLKDGKHLGKFKTPEEATAYAKKLHEDQDKLYGDKDENPMPKKKSGNGPYAVVSGSKSKSKSKTSSESKSESKQSNKTGESKSSNESWKEREQREAKSNYSKQKSSSQISVDDIGGSSSGATTRGLFDTILGSANKSNTPSVKPANLKSRPGSTHGTDEIKQQPGTTNQYEGRPIGHKRKTEFEKKSNAKTWHAKTATVSKGKKLGTYKQVGNRKLDEYLK